MERVHAECPSSGGTRACATQGTYGRRKRSFAASTRWRPAWWRSTPRTASLLYCAVTFGAALVAGVAAACAPAAGVAAPFASDAASAAFPALFSSAFPTAP
jgi:hypothetical protein